MVVGLADTHTVMWYMFGIPRLSRAAKAFIDDTVNDGNQIAI